MSAERDVNRIVRSWIQTDEHESADRVLQTVLSRLDATPQRRSWLARRSNSMPTYAKLIAAVAAVLVVAVVGYQFLPRNGGIGGQPTIAPSPSPTLLARGTFMAAGATVQLDATGGGDSVTGRMIVQEESGDFTVDLECTRTDASGMIWIGGDVTESANTVVAPKGTRAAIVLKRGSPVQAVFVFQMNDPRSASCQAFFDDMIAIGGEPSDLAPIVGTVELRP